MTMISIDIGCKGRGDKSGMEANLQWMILSQGGRFACMQRVHGSGSLGCQRL